MQARGNMSKFSIRNIALILGAFFIVPIIYFKCFAEDPPAGSQRLFVDFSKSRGFANYTHTEGLQETEAQLVENVELYDRRDLANRAGTRIMYNEVDSYEAIQGDFIKIMYSTTSGVDDKALAIVKHETGIYAYLVNPRYSAFERINPSFGGTVFLSVQNGAKTEPIIVKNKMYIVNDSSVSIYVESSYNNSYCNVLFTTAVPSGKYPQVHLDRFIVAGDTKAVNRVYYSLDDNPTNFHPLDFFDLTLKSNDKGIMGIGEPFLGMLPIYTEKSVRVMVGNMFPTAGSGGNLTERIIADNIGCVHHRTIKNRKDGQYFLSRGLNETNPGIYKFNGVTVQEMTIPVRNYFKESVSYSSTVIPSAFIYDDKYCVSLATPSGRYISQMVCLDELNRPTIYNGTGIYSDYWDVYRSTPFGVHSGPGDVNMVKALDKNIVTDVPIIAGVVSTAVVKYQTKDFDFGENNRVRKKTISRAYFDFNKNPGNVNVIANFDFGKSSCSWNVDMRTDYSSANIKTVSLSSDTIIDKLIFPYPSPSNPNLNKFNFVNFLITSTNAVHINSLDVYATVEPLP